MERNSVRFAVMLLAFSVGITAAGLFYFQSRSAIPQIGAVSEDLPQFPEGDPNDGKTLEMVFVIDTTGSMGGLIEGAKQKIWGIINEVMQKQSHPRVKVGLVAYRDHNDEYVTKVTPLTEDLDKVYSDLMDYNAAGGGDTPEAVGSALTDTISKAGWSRSRPGLAQIIFLVGDAPPQYNNNEPNAIALTSKAAALNIIVNTIQCGSASDTRRVWQDIAQHAQGKYFAIAQDGGVETIRTPYDDRLSELGSEIGNTYTAYGAETDRMEASSTLAETESKMAANTAASTRADRALNKAMNREAYRGDLLQDIENGKTKLETVEDKDLPDDLRAMPEPARSQEVQRRLGDRKKVREEILDLSKQRNAYVDAERKKSGRQNGFDAAVGSALAEQLAGKGIE
jgi:von Willebrand factor type A domain